MNSLPVVGEMVLSTFEHVSAVPTEMRAALAGLPENSVNHLGFVSISGAELLIDEEYMRYKRYLGYETPDNQTFEIGRSVAGYILNDARKQFDTNRPLGLAIELSNTLHPIDNLLEPDYEQQMHVDLPPYPDPGTLLYLAASNHGTRLVCGQYLFRGDQYKYGEDPSVQSLQHVQADNWQMIRTQMARGLHGRPQFDKPVRRQLVRAMVERR